MKRFGKILASLAICLLFVFMLVSCSSVNKKYADKINDAYKNGNALTYEQVKKDLGDECIDSTDKNNNGLIIAVKGMKAEKIEEKLRKASPDEKFEFISITVVVGQCQYAYYATGTANEILAGIEIKK